MKNKYIFAAEMKHNYSQLLIYITERGAFIIFVSQIILTVFLYNI